MLIRQILHARRLHPETILDLPSGFGRVTRFLRAAYPNATIYASDVNIHATRFCANFGAHQLPTAGGFDDIEQAIPTQVDLVWTGSLITHLPMFLTLKFFDLLSRILCRNGLAIVTNHGEGVARRLSSDCRYGLKEVEAVNVVLQGYKQNGYGYHDYPGRQDYGVACISNEWLRAAAARNRLMVAEIRQEEWAGQDAVVICQHQD